MPNNDRRLIEDLIPIREISARSVREKRPHRGSISPIHLWWSRKPLTASRIAVYSALIPAPASAEERANFVQLMQKLCGWEVTPTVFEEARKGILQTNGGRPPRVL